MNCFFIENVRSTRREINQVVGFFELLILILMMKDRKSFNVTNDFAGKVFWAEVHLLWILFFTNLYRFVMKVPHRVNYGRLLCTSFVLRTSREMKIISRTLRKGVWVDVLMEEVSDQNHLLLASTLWRFTQMVSLEISLLRSLRFSWLLLIFLGFQKRPLSSCFLHSIRWFDNMTLFS